MSEHTKEPWRVAEDRQLEIEGEYGDAVARVHEDGGTHDFHDARRIVACVNACAWIPTSDLEQAGYAQWMYRHLVEKLDKLLAAAKTGEEFMSGFEDDAAQEGIVEKLAEMRAAIAEVEGRS